MGRSQSAVAEADGRDVPLFKLGSRFRTRHVLQLAGWQRLESRQRVVEQVTNNIIRFAQGRPINQV